MYVPFILAIKNLYSLSFSTGKLTIVFLKLLLALILFVGISNIIECINYFNVISVEKKNKE